VSAQKPAKRRALASLSFLSDDQQSTFFIQLIESINLCLDGTTKHRKNNPLFYGYPKNEIASHNNFR